MNLLKTLRPAAYALLGMIGIISIATPSAKGFQFIDNGSGYTVTFDPRPESEYASIAADQRSRGYTQNQINLSSALLRGEDNLFQTINLNHSHPTGA